MAKSGSIFTVTWVFVLLLVICCLTACCYCIYLRILRTMSRMSREATRSSVGEEGHGHSEPERPPCYEDAVSSNVLEFENNFFRERDVLLEQDNEN